MTDKMRPGIASISNAKWKRLAINMQKNAVLYRLKKNLEQENVAKRCLLSRSTISSIERGKVHNPRLETIVELAKGLGLADPLDLLRNP